MWGGARFGRPWRPHQAEALAAYEASSQTGTDHNHYLVLPPGAGKTHVGLEIARRVGRGTVVLCPNTAIQSQWITAWRDFQPYTIKPSTSRELPTPLTVLTYQSVATFDPDAEVDEEGRAHRQPTKPTTLLDRLHDNGRALVERLRNGGPWTLVLDECHHLLDVWGRLLVDLMRHVTDGDPARVTVVGLTATPASRLTAAEHAIVRELFGDVTYSASAPTVVKTGHLAPYQELVMLTEPTAAERDYITTEAVRFAELVTDLTANNLGSTPFLTWCDARFVQRTARDGAADIPWAAIERQHPELAAAALRLHVADLLDLPPGARVREEHLRPLDAQDWAALIGDWIRGCLAASAGDQDKAVLDRLKRALNSVGYQVTRRGVRVGRSPVDRVLARSAAKALAAIEIVDIEHAALGDRLRAIVICDHERAAGPVSASLRGVLDEDAGSARLVLDHLLRDPTTAGLHPILMTARTVACAPATAQRLLGWLRTNAPDLAVDDPRASGGAPVVELTGAWTARQRVGPITRFFEEGHCQVLVGTRGLLGEGWDAKRVNVVVDLTTATTSTAVVQLRGRSVRLDPTWPDKVANTWTVVTVADGHPKGAADYARFVAKHDGYFAPDGDGQITSGVAHVDAALSPYGPPPATAFGDLNLRMRTRAANRERARELWRVGEPFEDTAFRVVRVRTRQPLGITGPALDAVVPPWRSGIDSQLAPVSGALVLGAAGLAAGTAASLGGVALGVTGVVSGLVGYGAASGLLAFRRLRALTAPSALSHVAAAVADALHAVGELPVGSRAVDMAARPDGSYAATLRGVPEAASVIFTNALDEVLAPLANPRYVVSRPVVVPPTGRGEAARLALRRALGVGTPGAEVWHAVPSVLANRRDRAEEFLLAWRWWVGAGRLVYASTPEGTGILAAQRGDDPFEITTTMRTVWR